MNRFVILALVAATAVSARSLEGANRGLLTKCTGSSCIGKCEVKTSVVLITDIEFKLRYACDQAIKKITTQVCKDKTDYLIGNQNITKTINVVAKAVAEATAEASIAIFGGVSYRGACDYGSEGKFKAEAVAVSYAKVVAEATASAFVKIYGPGKSVAWVDATTVAIKKACATAIARGFSDYSYEVGPPSAGWVTFTAPPVTDVAREVAIAIAKAYTDVSVQVSINVDAKKFPCDFVCPKCPPL